MIRNVSGFRNTREYLYIIKSRNLYKIGKTNSLEQRLEAIRSTNPHDVELVHSAKFDKAIPIEKALHKFFKTKRVSREWFALSNEDVSKIRQTIVKIKKANTHVHKTFRLGLLNQKKTQKRIPQETSRWVKKSRSSVVIVHAAESNEGFDNYFSDLGLSTLMFKSFREARSAIKKYRPFLIVIISSSGGLTPDDVERIREIKKTFLQMKVLFMSGIRVSADIGIKKMFGVDYFLKIPFQLNDLHKIMAELFGVKSRINNMVNY